MTKHRPLITIFTSIPNIGLALRTSNLPLLELVDDALQGYGGTIEFDASQLQPITQRQLQSAEILITEPAVLAKLLQNMELPKLKRCQSTYAGVHPLCHLILQLLNLPSHIVQSLACPKSKLPSST